MKLIINLSVHYLYLWLFSTTLAFAHTPIDPAHPTPIEYVGSSLAYPMAVHVDVTKTSTHVSGYIKRRGHKHVRIRGHVKVDLLDQNGKIVSVTTAKIHTSMGKVSRNRYVQFSLKIATASIKFVSIRVSHIRKKDSRHFR